jgi:hypothetical protein
MNQGGALEIIHTKRGFRGIVPLKLPDDAKSQEKQSREQRRWLLVDGSPEVRNQTFVFAAVLEESPGTSGRKAECVAFPLPFIGSNSYYIWRGLIRHL